MRIRMIVAAVLSMVSTVALASPDDSTPVLAGTVDEERISVVVEGGGADVILIPGLASPREIWAGLASRLRQDHRLHLVQIAGFAGSPAVPDLDGKVVAPTADAIAAYIQRHRIEAPVIIGHSLGGEVALMLGARHPDRVVKLMVVDALPFYTLLFRLLGDQRNGCPACYANARCNIGRLARAKRNHAARIHCPSR